MVKEMFFNPIDFEPLISDSYIPTTEAYVLLKKDEKRLVNESKAQFGLGSIVLILIKIFIMLGERSQRAIEEVLHGQVIGRIGCRADNTKYKVPISYAYDGLCIYVQTQESMKIKMTRKNPLVCFEVDSWQNMPSWQTVISRGEFAERISETERENALRKLHERMLPVSSSATTSLSAGWPCTPDDINNITGVVFRIRLDKKTGRFENNASPSYLALG